MTSIRVNAFVEQSEVVVTHDGETITELPPERAIECGGSIAELGKKILAEEIHDSEEGDQKGELTSGDLDQQEDLVSEDDQGEKSEPSTDGVKQVQEENPRDITTVSTLSRGEIYVGSVDRISNSGNAIIECPARLEHVHLNLGKIERSSVGEEVKFRYHGNQWCECLNEEYVYDSYRPREGRISSSTSSSNDRSGLVDELPDSHNLFNANGSAEGAENRNDLLNDHL